jgi:hypothetical protein
LFVFFMLFLCHDLFFLPPDLGHSSKVRIRTQQKASAMTNQQARCPRVEPNRA